MVDIIRDRIRAIPDFPQPGVLFRDITPLLADPGALKLTVEALAEPYLTTPPDLVAGMEARGFIFGSLVAQLLGVGFIPLRKPGKLPFDSRSHSYDLEYGQATLEIHIDAVQPGQNVLVVDDLLATGGTAEASCALLQSVGADIQACAFVIELASLGGRAKLASRPVHALITYS